MSSNEYKYCCVARDASILVQCAVSSGNFDVDAHVILSKINAAKDMRNTTDQGGNRYFIIHESSSLNFLIAGSTATEANSAFQILEDIKRRFMMSFGKTWQQAPVFGMQQEFSGTIQSLIQPSSHDKKFQQIRQNLNETKDQMADNMQQVLLRGNQLSHMEESADHIANSAKEYERQASSVRRKMCLQKYKWWILIAIIALIVLIIIILIACGKKLKTGCKTPKEEK